MTVAELIAELSKHDPDRVVYVGNPEGIWFAGSVEEDCFEERVGPAVLIEFGPDHE